MRRLARSAPTLTLALIAGCGPDTGPSAEVVRETLPNGATLVRYGDLPLTEAPRIAPDLEIGVLEGEAKHVFGDVRGIEVRRDGTILVLDYQASEIRAFDPQGGYLHTVASRGEGPGELQEVNGMILKGDSVLWVQDHAQWQMIALDPDGGELRREPMHVLSYGYIWSATVDDRGVFWKPTSHSDDERTYPPQPGLTEGTTRGYLKRFDPGAGTTDSIFLGERTYRTHISENSRGGWTYRGIPFDGGGGMAIAPNGGFWTAQGRQYRIAKLDNDGDTVLVIEADVTPRPVTGEDRAAFVRASVERDPEGRRTAEEIAALMPDTKPVISALRADPYGRLWVQRSPAEGEDTAYDVFAADGTRVGSVVLDFPASPYFPIVVREDALYTLTLDSLDVPRVVRAPLPPFEPGG